MLWDPSTAPPFGYLVNGLERSRSTCPTWEGLSAVEQNELIRERAGGKKIFSRHDRIRLAVDG